MVMVMVEGVDDLGLGLGKGTLFPLQGEKEDARSIPPLDLPYPRSQKGWRPRLGPRP